MHLKSFFLFVLALFWTNTGGLLAGNDSETTIYFLRHGQTNSNLSPYLLSQLDVSLNDRGMAEASVAASLLQNVDFEVCYASPMIRTKETAAILIGARAIPIIEDQRIIERYTGSWEGRLKSEFQNALPEEMPDVESNDQMIDRIFPFLSEIVHIHSGKTILVVSHGDVLSNIIRKMEILPSSKKISIPNCGLLLIKKIKEDWFLRQKLNWLLPSSENTVLYVEK